MKKGQYLNEVFDRLKVFIDKVENLIPGGCAYSPDYGVVTSCPTNVGTGMRASVHIPLPKLTADGTDTKAKNICKPLGLSVRGLGGEHTPIGSDGTIDLSPSKRFCISEAEIVVALYKGIKQVKEAEDADKGYKFDAEAQVKKINELKKSSNCIGIQSFDEKYFRSLSETDQQRLLLCINSGVENPDSQVGV